MQSIRFENVSVSFQNQNIIENFSHPFALGKVTAIIGPSGAGKSTIIKLANASMQPTSGSIYINEKNINEYNPIQIKRQMGYAIQNAGLFPHMRVSENISAIAKLEKWPKTKIDDRMKELASAMRLPEHLLHKYPHQISGGEAQRAALCRAVFLNPPVLLLDEPFSALDAPVKREIHNYFQQLQLHEKRTVILVTHDLREAIKLADYILVLNQKGKEFYDHKKNLDELKKTTFFRNTQSAEDITDNDFF